jgi:hypothetical protein
MENKKHGEVWRAFVARLAEAFELLTDEEREVTFLSALDKMLDKHECSGMYAIVTKAVTDVTGVEICDGMTVLDASAAPIKIYDYERSHKIHVLECEGMLDAALTLIKRVSGSGQERKELCQALLKLVEGKLLFD